MIRIEKRNVFSVKFNELEKYKEKLDKLSGLYFYHINRSLMYVGISDDLWHRFKHGYLKEDTKQHINSGVKKLITSFSTEIEVIFAPLEYHLLKEQETLFIQEYIPKYNEKENPLYQIRSIQRAIGRTVNISNNEWSYDDIREHLYKKWNGKVSFERINDALKDKTNNLSKYCRKKKGMNILAPR